MSITWAIIAWISFLLVIPMLIPYLADPTKRAFPTYIPGIIMFWALLVSFGAHLYMYAGYKNWICQNNVEVVDFFVARCGFQGLFLQFAILSTAMWIFLLGLNLVLIVFGLFPREARCKRFLEVAYHVVALLLPFALVLTEGLLQGIGAVSILCFPTVGASSDFLVDMLLLGWVCALTSAAAILCTVAVVRLAMQYGWPAVKRNLRIVFLVAIMLTVTLIWLTWTWGESIEESDRIQASFPEWAQCVATSPLTGVRCEKPYLVNFPYIMVVFSSNFAMALLMSLPLGWTDLSVLQWWKHILTKCSLPDAKLNSSELRHLRTTTIQTTTVRSSSTQPSETTFNTSDTASSAPRN